MQLKVIYFGTDLLSSCVDIFIEHGHSISAFYVGTEELNNQYIIEKANSLSVPIITRRPTPAALERHMVSGVDMFFSAEYQFKIPIPKALKYGINLHTSLLPKGRGAATLPYLMEQHPEAAGLTLHKLSDTFDQGDIILSRKVKVQTEDSLNTLSVKMHLAAPKILKKMLSNLDHYYQQATKQQDGENWPIPSLDQRLIDWYLPAEQLRMQFKAFGHFGSIMRLEDKFWRVTYAEVVQALSGKPPGHLLFQSNDLLAISCLDGFVCIPKSGISPI